MSVDNKKEYEQNRARIKKILTDRVPKTNMVIAKTLLYFTGICIVVFLLFQFGILKSKGEFVLLALVVTPILFAASSIWCILRKGRGRFFKYIFMVLLLILWLELEIMSGYKTKMLLPLLIILSLRYYNKAYTLFTYIISVLSVLVSNWCNAYLYMQTGLIDLNIVSFESNNPTVLQGFIYNNIIDLQPASQTIFTNGIRLSVLPNFIFLTAIMVIAMRFMRYNLDSIIKAEELAEKEANTRLALADMKTKVILSQIKPHFIYNTLSSIVSLCYIEPEKAANLTTDFSDYLRNNLDTLSQEDAQFCSFETELEHIKKYLNVELVRFEDELNVEYNIPEMLFSVPALSIQPIVENAIKHGISKKPGGGTVRIETRKVDNGHEVIISDDGVGFDINEVNNDGKIHVGIENIKNRLSIIGGVVNIESKKNEGTVVTVFVPSERGLAK